MSSRSLIDDRLSEALILGLERSGKSTLTKALYLGFQNKGLTPLLLQGHKIKLGYPFNRTHPGRQFSRGGSLEGAPGSAGARASGAAWATPPGAAWWR